MQGKISRREEKSDEEANRDSESWWRAGGLKQMDGVGGDGALWL